MIPAPMVMNQAPGMSQGQPMVPMMVYMPCYPMHSQMTSGAQMMNGTPVNGGPSQANSTPIRSPPESPEISREHLQKKGVPLRQPKL